MAAVVTRTEDHGAIRVQKEPAALPAFACTLVPDSDGMSVKWKYLFCAGWGWRENFLLVADDSVIGDSLTRWVLMLAPDGHLTRHQR